MKLKVGMYVRTKKGIISKITHVVEHKEGLHDKPIIVYRLDNGNLLAKHSRKVVKASCDITDLLEIGDLVKYNRVYCGTEYKSRTNLSLANASLLRNLIYRAKNNKIIIKEILTREQYEANVYRIGDDKG